MAEFATTALIMQQLLVQRGDVRLCGPLNVQIEAGQIWHVQGANGTGKTTLLSTLAGLLPSTLSALHWAGQPSLAWPVLYVGHLSGLNSNLSVLQNLQFLSTLLGQPNTAACLYAALAQVGLAGYEQHSVARLSSGQKRRVNLARLWLDDLPRLWLLDEPLTALDVQMVQHLTQRIQAHAARGGRVLLTSHQAVAGVTHFLDLAQHIASPTEDDD